PRESPGVSRPQRLVDLVSASVFTWRKGLPLGVRLASRWPDSILVSADSSTGEGLLGKILRHVRVRTASGILKKAFVDLLRKRCPEGENVGSALRIGQVKKKKFLRSRQVVPGELKRVAGRFWEVGRLGWPPSKRGNLVPERRKTPPIQ